jgi:hypothetical protein
MGNITVVYVNATTEDTDDIKDSFYEELECTAYSVNFADKFMGIHRVNE